MKSLKLIGLALGASFALSATAFAQDLNIAVAGPMTGGESAFGRQMKNGAEMAVTDINAAGGVMGKKLSLQIGDDACDPKQARSVAEKFDAELLGVVPLEVAGLADADLHRVLPIGCLGTVAAGAGRRQRDVDGL